MRKNPYEVLGLAATASQDEIKNAYRSLAKKFHPDLNPGSKDLEKKFKELAEAYELVGTPESRAKFDRGEREEVQGQQGPFYRETQHEGSRYMDDDLLRSIFGFQPTGDVPGEDALYRMDVELKDAVLGAEREITLPSGKRLSVKIPAGVDTGAKLRFAGLGSPGTGKASPGDAYVELHVRPSELFKRDGNDLEVELPISLSEAVLGGEVKVPTLEGSVLLRVPPGVSTGTRLRVAGKGGSGKAAKRGDLYVVLKLVAPPGVDADFKQAVESWSKRQSFDARAGWIGTRGGTS